MSSLSYMPSNAASPAKSGGERVTKRLQQELMQLMMAGESDCTAFPRGDNLFEWTGTIKGSSGTVYDGLSYRLTINFPSDYPYTAPTIRFATPCFHPNIDEHGNICLDILKEKWSAAYSVTTVLISLQSLLSEPNNESPLNGQAASLWGNEQEYKAHLLRHYQEATSKLE
mmetsp:Transcript_42514/g.49685  ORF Transcript_42514/g.49685 Transcript_42514/m.49685 type:complete len:170 (-) Transcript_42514:438-947(-)